MWQSRVEIEDYSVAYFDRIALFESLYHWTPAKGGPHTRFIDTLAIHASTKLVNCCGCEYGQWKICLLTDGKAVQNSNMPVFNYYNISTVGINVHVVTMYASALEPQLKPRS